MTTEVWGPIQGRRPSSPRNAVISLMSWGYTSHTFCVAQPKKYMVPVRASEEEGQAPFSLTHTCKVPLLQPSHSIDLRQCSAAISWLYIVLQPCPSSAFTRRLQSCRACTLSESTQQALAKTLLHQMGLALAGHPRGLLPEYQCPHGAQGT